MRPDIAPVTAPDPAVEAVLARHFADMRASSPEESCHVMTAQALRRAGASVYALRRGATVCAVGAFRPLPTGRAPDGLPGPAVELKSMHVVPAARGAGLGRDLLRHLIEAARLGGARSACLETGTAAAFVAARGLYLAEGFAICPPFGDYVADPLSVFMARTI